MQYLPVARDMLAVKPISDPKTLAPQFEIVTLLVWHACCRYRGGSDRNNNGPRGMSPMMLGPRGSLGVRGSINQYNAVASVGSLAYVDLLPPAPQPPPTPMLQRCVSLSLSCMATLLSAYVQLRPVFSISFPDSIPIPRFLAFPLQGQTLGGVARHAHGSPRGRASPDLCGVQRMGVSVPRAPRYMASNSLPRILVCTLPCAPVSLSLSCHDLEDIAVWVFEGAASSTQIAA